MRRRYLSNLYKDRIENVHKQISQCCIGADVIVGFPGETEEHFLQIYNFLEKLKFLICMSFHIQREIIPML